MANAAKKDLQDALGDMAQAMVKVQRAMSNVQSLEEKMAKGQLKEEPIPRPTMTKLSDEEKSSLSRLLENDHPNSE